MTHLPRSKFKLQGWSVTMLLVSLGVHAVLLVLPIPKQAKQQAKPLQPELTTVKITQLITAQRSVTVARQASPEKPVPKTAQRPQPKNPPTGAAKITKAGQSPTRAIATPLPTPASPPKATPAASLNPSQVPGSKQEAAPTPQPSTALPGSVTALFGDLAVADRPSNSSDRSVTPDLFTNPDLFFDLASLPTKPQLRPEILRATWIAAKTPMQVYVEILVVQGQSLNFQVSERGTYSQGRVYEVKQGENTWYFNLVPTQRAEGTAIVVWKQDPSTPL